MNRIEKLNKYLKCWQAFLNLQKWDLGIKLTEFKRKDYNQSGDIEVDQDDKKATVLVTKEDTGKDSAIVLHELVHLLLWEFDQYSEKLIPKNKKDQYFDLLEKTVSDLTKIILEKDK
jgi:hypothetical protein